MELTFEEFLQTAESLSSHDQSAERIQEANNIIKEFRAKNITQFILYSIDLVLLKNASPTQITNGLNFINSTFIPKRFHGIDFISEIYSSIPKEQKLRLRQVLLIGIKSPNNELQTSTTSTLSIIIKFEFPLEWPTFFTDLMSIYESESSGTPQRLGVLQSFNKSFQRDLIKPRYLRERDSALSIITNLVFQILSEETDISLKKEAVFLLTNSFKTTFHRNFGKNLELTENSLRLLQSNFEIDNDEFHFSIYNFFTQVIKKLNDKVNSQLNAIEYMVKIDLLSEKVERQKQALDFLIKTAKAESIMQNKNISPHMSQSFSEIIINLTKNVNETFNYFEKDNESLGYYAYKALKLFNEFDHENLFVLVQKYFDSNFLNKDFKIRCSSIIAVRSIINKEEKSAFSYFRSIFNDIMNLAQDPHNLTVRLYAQSLIGYFIKRDFLMENKNEEVQFIIDMFTELVQQDVQQTTSGIKIITNFLKRYDNSDLQPPLSTVEMFHSIVNPLWFQFERQEINNKKFSEFVCEAIILLCRKSTNNTIEIRKEFCIEVLNKFKQNANVLYSSQNPISDEMTKLQENYLDIFGKVMFSIRGILISDKNGQFINDIFEYFIQLLPNMERIPGLLTMIGNLVISSDISGKFVNEICGCLTQALSSKIPFLLFEGSMLLGDLFRKNNELLNDYKGQFCCLLLDIIEDDDVPINTINQSLMTLADIVRFSMPEQIIDFRNRILTVIQNLTHYYYDPDDQKSIEIMSSLLEGTIYLSGAVIKTFSDDEAFISDRKVSDCLFEFRYILNPTVFSSQGVDCSVILFLNCALSNSKAARILNIFLNHNSIKEYLNKIIDTSKNNGYVDRARYLKRKLMNA